MQGQMAHECMDSSPHKGAALHPTSKAEYGHTIINSKNLHTQICEEVRKQTSISPPKLGIKTSLYFIECHANYMDFPQNLLPGWKRTHEK